MNELLIKCDFHIHRIAKVSRVYPINPNNIISLCLSCGKKKVCIYCETQPAENKSKYCHLCSHRTETERETELDCYN